MHVLKVKSGHIPGGLRAYEKENIFHAVETVNIDGIVCFLLEHGQWIRTVGEDCYVTDWNAEECWGRVVEIEIDESNNIENETREIGFCILRIDRKRGLRLLDAGNRSFAPIRAAIKKRETDMYLPSIDQENTKANNTEANKRIMRKAYVSSETCRGCRICIKSCRYSAIVVSQGKARISNKCTGCGACVKICPFNALTIG